MIYCSRTDLVSSSEIDVVYLGKNYQWTHTRFTRCWVVPSTETLGFGTIDAAGTTSGASVLHTIIAYVNSESDCPNDEMLQPSGPNSSKFSFLAGIVIGYLFS